MAHAPSHAVAAALFVDVFVVRAFVVVCAVGFGDGVFGVVLVVVTMGPTPEMLMFTFTSMIMAMFMFMCQWPSWT